MDNIDNVKDLGTIEPDNFKTKVDKVFNTQQRKPKTIRRKLSYRENKYIAFCEMFYWKYDGAFPTNEQAAVALGYHVSEVATFLLNKKVLEALDRRGLKYDKNIVNNSLTPIQIAAAHVVLNPLDRRSINDKLDALGVNPQQYQGWLKNHQFNDYVNSIADTVFGNIKPQAITGLAQLVDDKEFSAIRFYLETIGFGKKEETKDIQQLIRIMIEIVTSEVKDPAVLARIGSRLMQAIPGASSAYSSTIIEDEEYTDSNFNLNPNSNYNTNSNSNYNRGNAITAAYERSDNNGS